MDKKYRTRDGRPARVLCVDRKDPDYPVVALVESDGGEVVYSYTSSGSFHISGKEPSLDLTEVKPIVKYLRPLHQILNENPGYFINEYGVIGGVGSYTIDKDMLRYFGKPRKEVNGKGWGVCPTWIEEREEDC